MMKSAAIAASAPPVQNSHRQIEYFPGAPLFSRENAYGIYRRPNSTALSRVATGPVAVPFSTSTIIGNQTAGDILEAYGNAVWQAWQVGRHPAPKASLPENIRQDAIRLLGGYESPGGTAMAARFNALNRYAIDLRAAQRSQLLDHPEYGELIGRQADDLMHNVIGRLSNGLPPDNAAGTLHYYVQPRIASARAAVVAQARLAAQQQRERERDERARAETRVQKELVDIRNFWHQDIVDSEEHINYLLTGRMAFMSEEEMERYCPRGDYVAHIDPFISQSVRRHEFHHEGGSVQEVLIRQPDDSDRRAIFRGDTWIYDEHQTPSDRVPVASGLPENVNRHRNPYWNSDRRVIEARASNSAGFY